MYSKTDPGETSSESPYLGNDPQIDPLVMDVMRKRSVAALPDLTAGRERRAGATDWDVLMRPVRATKQACLKCHTGTKQGDTLGVMVYAVRKTKRGEIGSIGML